jgi:hypothetical protein
MTIPSLIDSDDFIVEHYMNISYAAPFSERIRKITWNLKDKLWNTKIAAERVKELETTGKLRIIQESLPGSKASDKFLEKLLKKQYKPHELVFLSSDPSETEGKIKVHKLLPEVKGRYHIFKLSDKELELVYNDLRKNDEGFLCFIRETSVKKNKKYRIAGWDIINMDLLFFHDILAILGLADLRKLKKGSSYNSE